MNLLVQYLFLWANLEIQGQLDQRDLSDSMLVLTTCIYNTITLLLPCIRVQKVIMDDLETLEIKEDQ